MILELDLPLVLKTRFEKCNFFSQPWTCIGCCYLVRASNYTTTNVL